MKHRVKYERLLKYVEILQITCKLLTNYCIYVLFFFFRDPKNYGSLGAETQLEAHPKMVHKFCQGLLYYFICGKTLCLRHLIKS